MKKKINFYLIIIGLFSILAISTILLFAFNKFNQTQVHKDLEINSQLIIENYEDSSDESYLIKVKNILPFIRITLIDQNGLVLYDSDKNPSEMEDHSNRPEFIDALQNGKGRAIRKSFTLNQNTFYYAVKLDNGQVLRVARNADSVWMVFQRIIPIIALVGLCVFILCLIFSSYLTSRIVRPIENIAEDIDNFEKYHIYDELIPFVQKIKTQNKNINDQMLKLKQEKNKIQLITEYMSEGLLILDTSKNILTVNRSAVSLLGEKDDDYTGKNILTLSRNNHLNQCINAAAMGERKSVVIALNGKYLNIIANPVKDLNFLGIICFIVDVTDKVTAEKSRRDFTANVTHELKTPLTSISGYAEMIENGMAKPEDIPDFAGKIRKESVRLISLINDIINLSQLDSEQYSEKFELINLHEIVRDVADSIVPIASQKNISVIFENKHDTGGYKISGSRRHIEELVFNLCDNAVRYNKNGGSINIKLANEGGSVVLEVADTGIGIPQEHQKRVFERFYRVDKSRSKVSGGTGLGLAIVKHIVEQHKGKITLSSQEGKGTVIRVIFGE